MKENKRTIIMIIITIAVFLVAIIGATYAYFATERNVGSSINAGVATAKSSAFSSSTSGNIEFNVDFNEMSEAGASNTYIKTDNATLSVDLSSEDERSTTICNYDVVWVWDSTDRYTQSDVVLPYTHNDIEYPYEFSVQVGTDVEKDLSSLSWDYDGTAIISSKTIEVSQKGSKHEDFDVVVRMYNIPVNQANLFNKEFKAHIKVENLNCTSVRETKLAYYILNGEIETKVETVPKGGYRLNTDRTKCKRGGTVTDYNTITGELTTNIQMGDECEIYFDELPIITATGDSVTSNYDGTNKQISVNASDVTDYEVYYSLDKALTRENYSEGSTTHPEVKEIGTTKVYWCAVAENYAPYCSSNDIVIGEGIISLNVSDYNEAYDGNPHKLVVSELVPSTATMYYSETTPLTKDNYSTDGKTDEPERTTAGTSIIYWCAVADKYTPQCGENKIIVNPLTMTASGTNYNGEPDGAAHSITVNVIEPADGYDIYYSTTTELTKDNYSTSGTTTNPTRSELGTTTVYWCVVAPNYNSVCSSNTIDIAKKLSTYIMNDVYNSHENLANIENGVAGLYFHDENLANGAADNTYRYAGGYNYPKASEGYDNFSKIIIYHDYPDYNYSLAYDETNTRYNHSEAITKAINDGYLEEAINNYICFKEDDCTDENNLYRIISVNSVTNQTKVIKHIGINDFVWNFDAMYPDVRNNYFENSNADMQLNYNFNSSLGNKLNMIVDTAWSVGGIGSLGTPKSVMNTELNNSITYNAKIGLMYVSEYGFAALPEYWTKLMYDYEPSKNNNWMISLNGSLTLWTITRDTRSDFDAYCVDEFSGYVGASGLSGYYTAKPTFNLSSNVKITNADTENVGSKTNPMIIA